MDPKLPASSSVSPPSDLEHITQEMYKKNVELAETNKTLSLLRKIDDIILSSVTDPSEIAKHVAQTLIEDAEFQIASLYVHDTARSEIRLLGSSQSKTVASSLQALHISDVFPSLISLSHKNNLIVQTVLDSKKYMTKKYSDLVIANASQESGLLQQSLQIKTFFTLPLIVRGGVRGALVVGHAANPDEMGDFEISLLHRLADVIGIALDNALLYAMVQESNRRLQEVDKLKDEFVSLASHELRTPMTAIKSYLWMALAGKGGALSEKQTFYLDRAYRSTDRLIKLVNDMLNISRIESGRISIELTKVDIQHLVTEVIEEVSPRAQELGIQLTSLPFPSLPLTLADANKIKEVVINLIGNSLKFTPKGGSISVSFNVGSDGQVQVSVADTGAGIPAEDVPKLFQKFSLLPGSYVVNKTATQGTGLGLYICKSVIELHGGKIWVKSNGVGKGSVFVFTLEQFDPSKVSASKNDAVELVHTQL